MLGTNENRNSCRVGEQGDDSFYGRYMWSLMTFRVRIELDKMLPVNALCLISYNYKLTAKCQNVTHR